MRKFVMAGVLAAASLICFSQVSAQGTVAISPEKKALIAEMIVLTQVDKSFKDGMEIMFAQMDAGYARNAEEMISRRTDLSPSAKANLLAEMVASNTGVSHFRDRLMKDLDVQAFVDLMIYPIYDKFFTVEDLTALIEFHKSPVGRKMSEVSPQLLAESFRLAQDVLLPKILTISDKLIEEDLAKVAAPGQK